MSLSYQTDLQIQNLNCQLLGLVGSSATMTANVKSICDGRIFIERPAGTNALLKIFC